jgi:hypothetical protein
LRQELDRLSMADEARSYIQGMMKRQYEAQVQNFINSEIHSARSTFDYQKIEIRERYEAEIKEIRE